MTPIASRYLARTAQLMIAVVGLGFALTAQSGETLGLEKHRGKVVLVDFWASWCGPCRQSFPWLNEMQAKYADLGLVVIGVNVDRERADATRFLRDVPARFEMVYDPTGTLAAQYSVPGMPSSYVFGPSGELIGKHIGFRMSERTDREAELQRLLATVKP